MTAPDTTHPLSRRDVLKSTALAAGGNLLRPLHNLQRRRPRPRRPPLPPQENP